MNHFDLKNDQTPTMKKSKDPAFLFYSDNFQSGTQFFTHEQVGKYIRLLCAQHLHGHLPEKHMIFICGSYDNDVFSKFIKDKDGNYYNERLESEILKRKNYSESRSKNKKGKIICKSYDNHMGNGNGNEDININNSLKGVQGENSFCLNIEETKKRISEMPSWKENIQRVYKISSEETENYLTDFFNEIELKGEEVRTIQQTKSHFINWIKIQRNGKYQKHSPPKREIPPELIGLPEEEIEEIMMGYKPYPEKA